MTCETLTLGHNPFELPLSKFGVFLPSNRPPFLCERMISGATSVADMEPPESPNSGGTDIESGGASEMKTAPGLTHQKSHFFRTSGAFSPHSQYEPNGEIDPLDRSNNESVLDRSGTSLDLDKSSSGNSRFRRRRKNKNAAGSKSSSALLGAFESVFEDATRNDQDSVIEQMVDALSPRVAKAKEAQAAQKNRELRAMFDAIDDDGSGELDKDEFAEAYVKVRADLSREQIGACSCAAHPLRSPPRRRRARRPRVVTACSTPALALALPTPHFAQTNCSTTRTRMAAARSTLKSSRQLRR